jgi:DNA mismatch repair protein MutL
VRFYNANLVHSQILASLREKLLGTNLQTQAKLPATSSTGAERGQKIADAMSEFFKKHRPIQTQQQRRFPIDHFRLTIENQKSKIESRKSPNAIQIHDSFIVAQTEDGFIIIDQHALHERIIYEDLRRRISAGRLEAQKLLIPESFELTNAQAETLKTNAELIEKLGIEFVPFGPQTCAIQAFPIILTKAEPLDFVQDLIDLLDRRAEASVPEELLDEVLNMAACKAAIKAGQKLSSSEIEQLLADNESVERASYCPHGRPTTIKFSMTDLEKQFKRT